MVRVQLSAVKRLITTPIPNVAANPLTKPVPKEKRAIQLISVVKCPSIIDEKASEKPFSIDLINVFPLLNSSLTRSKIRTFASTAIPILRINPAIPGSVNVTGSREYIARLYKE